MTTTTATTYDVLKGKQTVTDYPYGRLQCTMTFELEFKAGKGYRLVTQSINPKTQRLNAPKKTTYNHFMFLHKDAETGHIKAYGFNFYGYGDIAKLAELFAEHDFQLSVEESQELWVYAIASIRGNARYTQLKEGVTVTQLLEATKVKEMIHLYGKKAPFNEITTIGYDVNEINALKI